MTQSGDHANSFLKSPGLVVGISRADYTRQEFTRARQRRDRSLANRHIPREAWLSSPSGMSTQSFRVNGEPADPAAGRNGNSRARAFASSGAPYSETSNASIKRTRSPRSCAICPDNQVAIPVGERPDARAQALGQPRDPGRILLRHLIKVSGVIRKPFIKLRLVAMEHGHDTIEFVIDVDDDVRLETGRAS